MNAERAAEMIEKLMDEKLKLAAVLNSKTLGGNKTAFIDDCQKRIVAARANLLAALAGTGDS